MNNITADDVQRITAAIKPDVGFASLIGLTAVEIGMQLSTHLASCLPAQSLLSINIV